MVREIRRDRVQQALDSVAEKKSDRLRSRGTRPVSTIKKKGDKAKDDGNASTGVIELSDDCEIGPDRVPFSASLLR